MLIICTKFSVSGEERLKPKPLMSNVNTVRFKKNWSVKQTASFYDLGSDQM